MQRQILYGKEGRDKILSGVQKVAKAVCVTMGPMGRNVIIARCLPSQQGLQYYMPFSTKDGVTVARNITLDDQLENTGANIIKQAADKTMNDAGDGTTTTCLLMKSILEEGLKLIEEGANPQELKKDIEGAVKLVVSKLKENSIPVGKDIEKIRQVATVSANNDIEIGNLIAEAFKKIGIDGMIDIEESKTSKTEIVTSDGIKIMRGWESQYFINKKAKGECELINPKILLYDKKITTLDQIGKILEQCTKQNEQLLIICEEADGQALAGLAMNASSGSFVSCIIKCPEFGELKKEAMEDLALITGATYISDEKGKSLKNCTLNDLGRAAKVIISKNETQIISPEGNKDQLSELIDNLKMDLTKAEGDDKLKIEKRIAKLTGGVAVLMVGAATEIEMKEKKDRVDDAIRATKAAISEGIVPGGGTSFLRVLTSNSVINKTLSRPLKQLCENAGVDFESIKEQVLKDENWGVGYNVKTNKIEDLIKSGIIDPVKVLRCSIENAASAATTILTTESLICDTM